MSHELRSPMTAIVGFADLLRQQIPGSLNAEQMREVRMISASAQHIMAVLNDALDVARIEAGQLECLIEPVDAVEVISEVTDMMAPLARAKRLALDVVREPPPRQPLMVRCDRQRSKQILVNLVSNAIKFTAHGHIQVSGFRDTPPFRIARASPYRTPASACAPTRCPCSSRSSSNCPPLTSTWAPGWDWPSAGSWRA
jgi:signal transduction histidine kinase